MGAHRMEALAMPMRSSSVANILLSLANPLDPSANVSSTCRPEQKIEARLLWHLPFKKRFVPNTEAAVREPAKKKSRLEFQIPSVPIFIPSTDSEKQVKSSYRQHSVAAISPSISPKVTSADIESLILVDEEELRKAEAVVE